MDVQLPAELWLQIGGHLPRADLNRLVRTGHALHSLLLPLLHRAIILSGPYRFATGHAKRLQSIRDTLARIGAKFELVTAIRSCTFQRVEGTLLEEAIAFLGTLPNLSSLLLKDLTLEANQLIRLSKSWRSPIEFVSDTVNVEPFDLPPSIIKGTPPNLSSLIITDVKCFYTSWRLFVQWSFSANLEIMEIGADIIMLKALFEEHISSLPKVSFPRLKSLRLSALPGLGNQGRFFDCMPMLENLDLTTFSQNLNISEMAIPRLRRYGGPGTVISSLVPRRPIRHLNISWGDDLPTLWGSRTSPILNFGSTSTIRYLHLPPTQHPLRSLQLVTVACPSLYELKLTCHRRFHFSEVSLQILAFHCLTRIN